MTNPKDSDTVASMKDANDIELAPGDRVTFYGLNPRSWETIGTFKGTIGPYAKVAWDARPDTTSPIHPSQIRKVNP